jgi:hypothetical protein
VLGPAAAEAPPGAVLLAANAEHAPALAARLPDDWLRFAFLRPFVDAPRWPEQPVLGWTSRNGLISL